VDVSNPIRELELDGVRAQESEKSREILGTQISQAPYFALGSLAQQQYLWSSEEKKVSQFY
jgi:hypothetical protein